jgi:FimV-like protein
MGDADSANSALEEIIASGSEEQKREAESLQAQLK